MFKGLFSKKEKSDCCQIVIEEVKEEKADCCSTEEQAENSCCIDK